MSRIAIATRLTMVCCLLAFDAPNLWASAAAGLFEDHADVGSVLHPGALVYDPAKATYTISGSGSNIWSTADAFHFVWKKVTGDVSLAADISFLGSGGNEHRKAVLIVRQSLDADSAYVDVALHGNGLTALQYRNEKGAVTQEIQSNVVGPKRLRIKKRGNFECAPATAAAEERPKCHRPEPTTAPATRYISTDRQPGKTSLI